MKSLMNWVNSVIGGDGKTVYKWSSISLYVLGCIPIVFLGISVIFIQNAPQKCDMTFMYMYPQFINVPLDKQTESSFPNYKLKIYGEGLYAEHLRSLEPEGIPVLFIPGNAGSYRQVRSLASVSMTKSGKSGRLPVFNYFTIDFDEELSGLYGGYLWNQTAFAAHAIKHVFRLYKHLPKPPKKIIIVGHSLGGLIARGIVLMKEVEPRSISLIITLATPHSKPVLAFDSNLVQYTNIVNRMFETEGNRLLKNLVAVSIGGGVQDFLVRTDLTLWPSSLRKFVYDGEGVPKKGMVLVEGFGDGITGVWTGMDHLCIVWCNQLVLTTVRAFFDMSDKSREQITSDRELILRSIVYHFQRNFGPKSIEDATVTREPTIKFGMVKEIKAITDLLDKPRIYETSVMIQKTVLYKLLIDRRMIGRSIYAMSTQDSDSVFFRCHPENGCNEVTAILSHQVSPAWSLYQHLHFDDPSWEGSSIVIPAYFHSSPRSIFVSLYDKQTSKSHETTVLNRYDALLPYKSYQWTFENHLGFYNITLNNFVSLMQVYRLKLIPLHCPDHIDDEISGVSFTFDNAPYDSYHGRFRFPYNATDDLLIHRQHIPNDTSAGGRDAGQIKLFMHPECRYSLTLEPETIHAFAKVPRYFVHLLPSICIFQLLILLSIVDFYNSFHRMDCSLSCVFPYCCALIMYQLFILICSNESGMDFLAAVTICLLSVSLNVIGYFIPWLLVYAPISHLQRTTFYKKVLDYTLWGNDNKDDDKAVLAGGVGGNSAKKSKDLTTMNNTICGIAILAVVGQWSTIPGPPLLLFLFILHLIIFTVRSFAQDFLSLSQRNLDDRAEDEGDGDRQNQQHRRRHQTQSNLRVGVLVLEMAIILVALLIPSIIIWAKQILDRMQKKRMNGHFFLLSLDSAAEPALMQLIALTLPSHPKILPYKFIVPVVLGVLCSGIGWDATLPTLAKAMSVAVGLFLNPNYRPSSPCLHQQRGGNALERKKKKT